MNSRATLLLVLVALFLALGGGGLWLLISVDEEEPAIVVVAAPQTATPPGRNVAGGTAIVQPRTLRTAEAPPQPTTVLWPLEVSLDLERPSFLPLAGDVVPGSGRRSRLAGRIAGSKGEPVAASVEFVAGANEGRVLLCDSRGEFGANDLYPGIAVVEVRGPGIRGSRREIVLRQNTEFLLNIGYGRPGGIQGEVLDVTGEPIADAQVWVDGQFTRTDDEGYFYIGGLASDRALLEIEADGYAGHREVIGITANFTIPRGRLVYKLQPATTLEVFLSSKLGAAEEAEVIILPADTKQQRSFPWYRVNPVRVRPGSSITVPNLPSGLVSVRVFHRGAIATPPDRTINLRPQQENRVEIELKPAPLLRGTVVANGAPIPGARVRLEAPDRVRATLGYFRSAHWFLESEILPTFPFAVQETLSDAKGEFTFTAWADITPTRYLEAWSPDGSLWASRMVGSEDGRVTLDLGSVDHGNGELVLELPGRTQGLDVELSVNGTPAEPIQLGPDGDLVVDELLEGTWTVRASWYGEPVLEESGVKIDGLVRLKAELPEDAIVGQGRDAWERAGRTFPASE